MNKSNACHNKIPNQQKLIKFKVNTDVKTEHPTLAAPHEPWEACLIAWTSNPWGNSDTAYKQEQSSVRAWSPAICFYFVSVWHLTRFLYTSFKLGAPRESLCAQIFNNGKCTIKEKHPSLHDLWVVETVSLQTSVKAWLYKTHTQLHDPGKRCRINYPLCCLLLTNAGAPVS